MSQIKLLNNVSVDTTGTGWVQGGGRFDLSIFATSFGGGAVQLQLSANGGTTWVAPTINGVANSFTANSVVCVDFIGTGMLVRAVLSGSSGASGVCAFLDQ